ncbi:MAG: dTDP-4-dehydrorhamnose reductase [Planctomycetes bacterium]|nr:dTDP-4-dehydrorhamnose reductase [Planctomycetota bacterium]
MDQLDYLVTGALGQLGRIVTALAGERGRRAFGVDFAEMPLEQRSSIMSVMLTHRPRFVIHCGAMTNVDGCEREPLDAYRINGLATAWLAEAAAAVGAGMLYVSTDFVFDGAQQGVPYAVDAPPAPLSVYGASKRLGEEAVLAHGRADFYVTRTSWVYGPGGRNFPRAILERARAGQPLKVVTDQVGRPTLTCDLAAAMLDLVESGAPGGIYHAANEGFCSWHRFAVDVLQAAGLGDVEVGEQLAADLDRAAPRPSWSVLDTTRLREVRGLAMPHYTAAIARYLELEDELTAAAGDGPGPDPGCDPGGNPGRGKDYS